MTTKEKLAAGASKEELIQAYIDRVETAEKELLQEQVTEATKTEDAQNLYAATKTYLCKYVDFSPEDFPPFEDFLVMLDDLTSNMKVLTTVMKSFLI